MLIEDQDFLRSIIAAPAGTVHCVEFRLECVVQCERVSGLDQTEGEMRAYFTASLNVGQDGYQCWIVRILGTQFKCLNQWFNDQVTISVTRSLEDQIGRALDEQEQIDSDANAAEIIDGEGNSILPDAETIATERADSIGYQE